MYPPEPWDLRGQMYLSVFALPESALPRLPEPLASTVRPVLVAGRAAVGAAWVRYEPGGTLHYRELLSATLVHEHGRPRVSITDIWVDSVASRDGGRGLWGIPKDLADLELLSRSDGVVTAAATAADDRAGTIASATFSPGLRVPGRWPAPMSVAQVLAGTVKRTGVRGRTGLRLGGARWQVDPAGPLGYLAGRRPLLTVSLTDFRLRFGAPASTAAARRS